MNRPGARVGSLMLGGLVIGVGLWSRTLIDPEPSAPIAPPAPTPPTGDTPMPDLPDEPVPAERRVRPPSEDPTAEDPTSGDPTADPDGELPDLPPAPPDPEEGEVPLYEELIERSAWPATPEGILGAVHESTPALQACYEDALAARPDLSGRLVLAIIVEEVEGEGRVIAADVDGGDLADAPLEACILGALSGIQLDAPSESLHISLPITFSSDPDVPPDPP